MAEQLKLPEVAQRLGVSEKTARRYVKSGAIPSMFVGGAYRVSEEDLETFLQGAKVTPDTDSPKDPEQAFQPSLNGLLEDERRESVYGPWLELVNRYTDRWERQLETGDFDLGRINEFVDVAGELMPVMRELNTRELNEFPVESDNTFGGREALTGRAIWRILGLLQPLANASHTKFENSDLEKLRRKRESLEQWEHAASG